MATKARSRKSAAALQHPIRVVPLHLPEAQRIAAAAVPQLTYRGGPLLTAVEVFTVFGGAEWKQAEQSALVTNMNLFFDYILTSALMDQLGEYSVPGKNIGHGNDGSARGIQRPWEKYRPRQTHGHRDAHFTSSKLFRARQRDSTDVAAGNRRQESSGAFSQFTLFFLSTTRRASCAGRQRFLPGVLRLSRLHQRQHFLCGHALPRMFRVHRRPQRH